MKRSVQVTKMVAFSILVSLVFQLILPIMPSTEITAQAATSSKVKLNRTQLVIFAGDHFQLYLTGLPMNVKWSSSKKSVATVSSSGYVNAKAPGKATIKAKYKKKTYTCKVTVKAVNNDFVNDAPFDAKNGICGVYEGVIPKSWTVGGYGVGTEYTYVLHDSSIDEMYIYSGITVKIDKSGAKQKDFNKYKKAMDDKVTTEYLGQVVLDSIDQPYSPYLDSFSIDNLKNETKKSSIYRYDTYSYDVVVDGKVFMKQKIYYLFANGYTTQIVLTDLQSETTPAIKDVFDYFTKSFNY